MNALALALIIVAAIAFCAVAYVMVSLDERQIRQHEHEERLAERRGDLVQP
jgi:cell division protein FtsL